MCTQGLEGMAPRILPKRGILRRLRVKTKELRVFPSPNVGEVEVWLLVSEYGTSHPRMAPRIPRKWRTKLDLVRFLDCILASYSSLRPLFEKLATSCSAHSIKVSNGVNFTMCVCLGNSELQKYSRVLEVEACPLK